MRGNYISLQEMGKDPAEFLNVVDRMKQVYRIYAPKKINERQVSRIINKFGYKTVMYTLNRLMDEIIRDGDMQQPYRHLDYVAGNMKRAYDAKVAASRKQSRPAA